MDKLPQGTRCFGSWIIDELKRSEKGCQLKIRLIAQNYQDNGASDIATKVPTVHLFFQIISMAIAASIKGGTAFTRDITQA